MFRRKRKLQIEDVSVSAGAEEYRPGLFYYAGARAGFGTAWAGPKYLSAVRWRADLAEVIGQIRAVVQSNANLPAGLQAAAREHRRQLRHWTQRRIGLYFRATFIPVTLLFLFLLMIAMGGFNGAEALGYGALISGIFCTGYGVVSFYNAGKVEAVMLKLRDDLEEGYQLSEAMRRMNHFFPPLTADLVAMGESTGQLAQGLEHLSDEVLDHARHRTGLGRQGMYFILVALIQFTIILFISVKVMPVFVEILEEFGSNLPPATATMMSITDFILGLLRIDQRPHSSGGIVPSQSANRFMALIATIAVAWMVWWLTRGGGARRIMHTPRGGWWLYLPFAAGMVRAQNLSMIGQLMAALLRAGMPLPEALEKVAVCRLSGAYRRGLKRVAGRIENGDSIGDAIRPERRFFPAGFQTFVRLGERSGLLAEAFSRTGEQYRRRHETAIHYARTLLTPLGIVLLGCVNLFVCMTAFEVLTHMADSIMGDL